MTTPMLLGIAGKKKSGKNTAASILEEWCGDEYTARSQGLADVLKVSAARALGLVKETPEQCIAAMDVLKFCGDITTNIEHGQHDIQEIMISGREYLQFYGTEAHREVFGDSFWIDYLLPIDKMSLYRKWGQSDGSTLTALMMVTDVRFPNEAERVKEHGGFVLEIRKPEDDEDGDQHASEQRLPARLVDEIINNDEGIAEFDIKIMDFAERRIRDGLGSGLGRWA